jgi:DNA-binding NtrC family response regulator
MNILFVDDDHAFAESCVSILVGEGHMVSYSENAEDAKHKLYDSNFDIAIVDLMLPPTFSREGLDLLKHIRKINPNLICLMVTNKQENTIEIVAESMKAGATNFLDKGTNIFFFKLRTTIKEIILESKDKIFLSHGKNNFIKLKIKDFIQERLKKKLLFYPSNLVEA